MELSKLNSAIRNAENVKVRFSFGDVQLHRPSLLEALKTHFGGERKAETELTVTPEGYLQFENRENITDGRALAWADRHPPATEQAADDGEDLSSLA